MTTKSITIAFITLLSPILVESASLRQRQLPATNSDISNNIDDGTATLLAATNNDEIAPSTAYTRQLLLDFHGRPSEIFNQDFTILADLFTQEYNKATQELCADASSSMPVMIETEFLPNLVNGYGAEPRNIAGNLDFSFIVNTRYTCPDCIEDEQELELIFVDPTSTPTQTRHLQQEHQRTKQLRRRTSTSSSSLLTKYIESSITSNNNHERKLLDEVCVPDSHYFMELYNKAIKEATMTSSRGLASLSRVTELEAAPTSRPASDIQVFSSEIEMTMKGESISAIVMDDWRVMEEMILESYNQVNALNADICDPKSRVAQSVVARFGGIKAYDEWTIKAQITGYCWDCEDEKDEMMDDSNSPASRRFLEEVHRRTQARFGRNNQPQEQQPQQQQQQQQGSRSSLRYGNQPQETSQAEIISTEEASLPESAASAESTAEAVPETSESEAKVESEAEAETTSESDLAPTKEVVIPPLLVSSFCPISAKKRGMPTTYDFSVTVDDTIKNAKNTIDDAYAYTPPQSSSSQQHQITTLDFLSGIVYEAQTCCGAYNKDWKAVDVDGYAFANAIEQYMNDPMSSPYGSQINCWDVSQVTDMSYAFADLEDFNEDLSCWDTSNVESMLGMFRGASKFNQNIAMWDVSKVKQMNHMFHSASKFDQDLSGWDISSVISISAMFYKAASFDQDLCAWTAKDDSIEFNTITFAGSACEAADFQVVGGVGPYCHVCVEPQD